MRRLLVSLLACGSVLGGVSLGMVVINGAPAAACEKHLNGHQNGSDTDLEGSRN